MSLYLGDKLITRLSIGDSEYSIHINSPSLNEEGEFISDSELEKIAVDD